MIRVDSIEAAKESKLYAVSLNRLRKAKAIKTTVPASKNRLSQADFKLR
jgi:hypothetical protein